MTELSQPRVIKTTQGLRSALNNSGADIGAYLCISRDSTLNEVILTSGGNVQIDGTTTETFTDADGVYYTYQTEGVAKCTASAAVTIGALVMPDAAGKVLTRTGTNSIVGTALTSSTVDGDIIEVELLRQMGA